jgi:hypothetical protein
MWKHDCPVDGELEVSDGAPCNWCGADHMPTADDPRHSLAMGRSGAKSVEARINDSGV